MKQIDLSQYDNSWYQPGGFFKRTIWYFINVLFIINPLNPSSSLKIFFLKSFGARIGRNVTIKPLVNVKYPWFLTIGDNCWIGESVWIDNLTMVNIGSNVCLSQGAMLLTGNHNYKKPTFDLIVGGITIDNGCWVGAKSIVAPGVRMHTHSILEANSLATKDLEAYGIYIGTPCSKVKDRVIE